MNKLKLAIAMLSATAALSAGTIPAMAANYQSSAQASTPAYQTAHGGHHSGGHGYRHNGYNHNGYNHDNCNSGHGCAYGSTDCPYYNYS